MAGDEKVHTLVDLRSLKRRSDFARSSEFPVSATVIRTAYLGFRVTAGLRPGAVSLCHSRVGRSLGRPPEEGPDQREFDVQSPHHPVVGRTSDGRWVVACAECRRDRRSAIPIGIDMPMQSLEMAELMRDNHARVRIPTAGPERAAPG